jgi:hypothetical protein
MDKLDDILRELGYGTNKSADAEETPTPDQDVYLLRSEPTARDERIIDRTLRWIAFLKGQADKRTDVAARLYARLAAAGVFPTPALPRTGPDSPQSVIEQLEWTLAALEWWIEEQQPADVRARFRVRWAPPDPGSALWTSPDDRTEPASLREVVTNAAEVEGGFPFEDAIRVAAAVVEGLESGDVNLLRVRRVEHEPHVESVFELIPRDQVDDDRAPVREAEPLVPAETEVIAADGQVAAFLDSASYAAARVDANGGPTGSPLDTDLAGHVVEIARSSGLPRKTVAKGLLALVNEQLESAARAGDQGKILRLSRAVTALVTFMQSE